MPRSPKKDHPIRRLRAIIGKSQREFARMIGISVSTLQRIELGSLRLNEKIAGRIFSVTDASVGPVSKPSDKVHNRRHSTYTKRDFDLCQSRLTSSTVRHECERKKSELRRRIDVLLDAAYSKRRFPLVESDLWEALNKIRVTHGLERLTEDLLRADKGDPRPRWEAIARPDTLLLFREQGLTEHSIHDSDQMAAWSRAWDALPAGAYAYTIYNFGVLSSTVEDEDLKALFKRVDSRIGGRDRRKRARA